MRVNSEAAFKTVTEQPSLGLCYVSRNDLDQAFTPVATTHTAKLIPEEVT